MDNQNPTVPNLTNSQDPAIVDFVEKLIEERKFGDIPTEVLEEIRTDAYRQLDEFTAARIIAGFSDEDVITFEEMLKNGTGEAEVQEFVSGHIPNFVDFLTNTLLEFRGVYLGQINAPIVENPTAESSQTPANHAN